MKPADYMAYLHPYSHQSMAMDDFLLGIPNTMPPQSIRWSWRQSCRFFHFAEINTNTFVDGYR
jgi:hypothetical protein